MPEYHYSNDPKDTYTTLLSVGTKSSPGLHSDGTSLREVWTDDGDDTKSNAPFQLAMDAMQMQGTRRIEFNDSGTYMYSSAGAVLDMVSDGDINLSAAVDINILTGVGLVFGADTEKIEGTTGSNLLALTAAGALNITGGAASTWKTTAGAILIDSEAAALTLDGHAGVNIAGTNGSEVDITTTGLVDINSATLDIDASGAITIDTSSTLSIDVTGGASNITSATDATAEDFTIALTGATNSSLILSSTGTATDALQMTASAGGINISATGSAGKDIDIVNTGGSVNISATEDLANAIVLYATTGGIDLIADGADGKDIDLTCVNGSINITSGEDIANAIYLHADAGTSETVKIHADQSTAIKSIELLSDLGGIDIQAGKTGAITNMTSGSDDSDFTAAPIKIGTTTANVDIAIGHGTSDVHIGGNLKVAENLYVVGAQSFSALTVSHATDPVLTIDNLEHAGNTGKDGNCQIVFSGVDKTGDAVAMRARIFVDHPGTSDDQLGDIYFQTNSGSEGSSPGNALRLLADSSAAFYDNVTLAATKKLIFDSDEDSDTYIYESSADDLKIVVNGAEMLHFDEGAVDYLKIKGNIGLCTMTGTPDVYTNVLFNIEGIDSANDFALNIDMNDTTQTQNSVNVHCDSPNAKVCYLDGGKVLTLSQRVAPIGTGGYALQVYRNTNEAGAQPMALFSCQAAANTQPTIKVEEDGIAKGIHIDCTHASYTSNILELEATRNGGGGVYNFIYMESGDEDPEALVNDTGEFKGAGAYGGVASDYAEYFESTDGKAIAPGTTVVMENGKIKAASSGETPIGIIRPEGASLVVGNSAWNRWQEKYEKDDFGAVAWESYVRKEWTETTNEIFNEEPDGTKTYKEIQHSYPSDEIPEGVSVPRDAVAVNSKRRKRNASYDSTKTYIPREDREEWNIVGLLGQIPILKGQPVSSNWIKMKDVSSSVEMWFVR